MTKHLAYHERAEKEGRALRAKPNKRENSRSALSEMPPPEDPPGQQQNHEMEDHSSSNDPSQQGTSSESVHQTTTMAHLQNHTNDPPQPMMSLAGQQSYFPFGPFPNNGQPIFIPSGHADLGLFSNFSQQL